MTPWKSPSARFRRVLPLWAGALAALAGCGGGGGDPVSDFGPLKEERVQGSELAVLADFDLRNVPVVFLDRQRGAAGFLYRIQGQEYQERELLGLCHTLVENDPNAAICLVPSGALTVDEVGLVEAKLREAGLVQIRILGVSGRRK